MSSLFALLFVLGFMGGPATQQPQQMARHSSPIQHTVFMPTQIAEVEASCIHVVQRGEWLSRITPNWRAVASANGIRNPNWIYVGERINLCVSGSGGASYGSGSAPTTAAVIPANSAAKGANSYPWGYCTYGAEQLAHDDLNYLGDASSWFYNAQRRGLPTGYVARADSTAVFQAGYHVNNWGTSGGHVAHVDAVSGNMMEITEMNNSYYGSFGRYDTIWIAIAPGVSFIY